MPNTAFMGVRISWLMVARNALLAASLALARSRSERTTSSMSITIESTPSIAAARTAPRNVEISVW